ncbi:carboxymuconolactone decarboxylase family protein [Roseococcus sp.]|uniref:carboxymuconolactone decarboxylase family protein n=1 Tax=Roseococcus sp. TaxID=2109646 RepID=UPI003BABA4A7
MQQEAPTPTAQDGLKRDFIDRNGVWDAAHQHLLDRDPDFFRSYLQLSTAAAGRSLLSPKMRELVGLAANAAVTHLHAPAIRLHMRAALQCGATSAEIMEVLQLISVLGIHSCSLGITSLTDELQRADLPLGLLGGGALSGRQEAIKAAFLRDRGYWSERWETLLRLDPDYFEAYGAYSSYPWQKGTLAPKDREFLYIAIDASTTHLYDPGLRVHYRNALRLGASVDEIFEVLKLTSLIGIQSCTLGASILAEELARLDGQPGN